MVYAYGVDFRGLTMIVTDVMFITLKHFDSFNL